MEQKKRKKKNFTAQMCALNRRPSGVTPYCAPLFRVRYLFATLSHLGAEPVRRGSFLEDLLSTHSAK